MCLLFFYSCTVSPRYSSSSQSIKSGKLEQKKYTARSSKKSDFKNDPIFIKGFGETSSHSSINYMEDMSRLDVAIKSSEDAYNMSKMSPSNIDFAMIYDSFTYTVLVTLESLGFCGPGEGPDFVANQVTAPGGSFPLNTSGGGLSYTHPGMYGIFTVIEAVRQLRGETGERQLDNCDVALAHGTGGLLSSTGTVLLTSNN